MPFQIVLLTSSCGAGRREIKRFVFILYCFPVRIKEFTHNCTPYAKWGVVILESSLERYLSWQSSPHIWLSKKMV